MFPWVPPLPWHWCLFHFSPVCLPWSARVAHMFMGVESLLSLLSSLAEGCRPVQLKSFTTDSSFSCMTFGAWTLVFVLQALGRLSVCPPSWERFSWILTLNLAPVVKLCWSAFTALVGFSMLIKLSNTGGHGGTHLLSQHWVLLTQENHVFKATCYVQGSCELSRERHHLRKQTIRPRVGLWLKGTASAQHGQCGADHSKIISQENTF